MLSVNSQTHSFDLILGFADIKRFDLHLDNKYQPCFNNSSIVVDYPSRPCNVIANLTTENYNNNTGQQNFNYFRVP